jgi:hypothetical protein
MQRTVHRPGLRPEELLNPRFRLKPGPQTARLRAIFRSGDAVKPAKRPRLTVQATVSYFERRKNRKLAGLTL